MKKKDKMFLFGCFAFLVGNMDTCFAGISPDTGVSVIVQSIVGLFLITLGGFITYRNLDE